MALRYRSALPLVAVSLALAVAPALAAKDAPTPNPLPAAPLPEASITAAPCLLGQTDAGAGTAQFILLPDDAYQTLVDPASCQCGGAVLLSVAHMELFWQTDCSVAVSVSVLGALGGPGCYTPDLTNVLCPATTYLIDGSGAAGGLKTHDFPLPAGCCISGPAFLQVTFLNAGNCPLGASSELLSPALVYDASPAVCTSHNSYPAGPVPVDIVTTYGFPGNLHMWVDGDCCGATPTLPSSWGTIKTLYR